MINLYKKLIYRRRLEFRSVLEFRLDWRFGEYFEEEEVGCFSLSSLDDDAEEESEEEMVRCSYIVVVLFWESEVADSVDTGI